MYNGYEKILVPALAFSICAGSTAVAEVSFPGKEPGKAKVECSESSASLSNKMFTASFRNAGSGAGAYTLKIWVDTKDADIEGSGTIAYTLPPGKGRGSRQQRPGLSGKG